MVRINIMLPEPLGEKLRQAYIRDRSLHLEILDEWSPADLSSWPEEPEEEEPAD